MTPTSTNDDILHDIWDGSALRPLCAPGRFFSNKNHLALSLSTDGVPLFKSSKLSLWPVYLVILNLPPNIRMNSKNVILCGIWVGPTKPAMDLLLNPVTKCLQKLSTIGLDIFTPAGTFTVRAKLVIAVFDLPAKAAVLCAKQFNGEYGCSVCLHPGKRLPNNSRVYLPDVTYADRTHSQVLDAALQAVQTNSTIQGVYGRSPLSDTIDLVCSIPVDYMHCVLEGVSKWLINSWFNSHNHVEPYYIGRRVREIDNQLLKQRPPTEFSRPPRSIQKHFKYWKASELRHWLLFYSLPLLLDYLPSLYYHHYALFVCAIHMLLSDSITSAQIDAAEQMLSDFCHLMPELYGEKSCTHNCHLLSHLAKYVRLWGPLWTHSAFGFESKNGHLKHLFHSKTEIIHQLLFNTDVLYTLQHVHNQLLDCESEKMLSYLGDLTSHSNMRSIGDHTYMVGKSKMMAPTAEQSIVLGSNDNIEVFSRLFKDGILYYSSSWGRGNKRDNTHCTYQVDTCDTCFGIIELFVPAPTPCALIRQLVTSPESLLDKAGHPCRTLYHQVDLLNSYIVPVEVSNNLSLIPIESITTKAVFISVPPSQYCIVHPNKIERH